MRTIYGIPFTFNPDGTYTAFGVGTYVELEELAREINLLQNTGKLSTVCKCEKCGKEFDLYKYGCPDPYRSECFECKPIRHNAPSRKRNTVSWDDLDFLEGRCLVIAEV